MLKLINENSRQLQPPAYKKINSVDPDQTAPLGSVRPGSTLPKKHAEKVYREHKHTTDDYSRATVHITNTSPLGPV